MVRIHLGSPNLPSIPLQHRAAKGWIVEPRAEINAWEARSCFPRDRMIAEGQGITIGVGTAEQFAKIAERRRFELGWSAVFLVNQREETAKDARVRLIDAHARIAAARAELAAATADRSALGLEP